MRHNPGEIKELLDTIDMESWLDREGVRYRTSMGSSGRQANVKTCPCCGNDHWKVYIGLESGLGNCFVCEKKFSKWGFIQSYLGVDNRGTMQHVKAVASEQGWRPPKLKAAPRVVDQSSLRLPASIELPHRGRNLKYLENRRITGPISLYFGLRFSQAGYFEYEDHNGRPIRQDYSNRIIIPVFDLEGKLVSFQGRDITDTAADKYLFPPGFTSTGKHLYNGQNAIGAERILIGEGVFDVAAQKIALDEEMSLRDVVPVGTFGKHLSHGPEDSQLGKLLALKAKGLKNVTFQWDGEAKALLAAIEAALLVHSVGLTARLAVLPAGCDPNEVAPKVVRDSYYQAKVVTPATAAMLKMNLARIAA